MWVNQLNPEQREQFARQVLGAKSASPSAATLPRPVKRQRLAKSGSGGGSGGGGDGGEVAMAGQFSRESVLSSRHEAALENGEVIDLADSDSEDLQMLHSMTPADYHTSHVSMLATVNSHVKNEPALKRESGFGGHGGYNGGRFWSPQTRTTTSPSPQVK